MTSTQKPKVKGKFRLKNKKFFLTYSQANGLTKDEVASHLKSLFTNATTILVAEEEHKDGGKHFHAFIELSTTFETTNSRYWDIKGCHPNVQGAKNKQAVTSYITKYDIDPSTFHKLDISTPASFAKRKRDFESWLGYLGSKKKVNCALKYIKLSERWSDETGERAPTHVFSGRDGGSMVLIGPSGIGKTTMVIGGFTTEGDPIDGWMKEEMYFMVKGTKTDYHYEGYQNQPFIIYDDVVPVEEHLLHLLQRYRMDQIKVPGCPRYETLMMKGDQVRNVIVITNPERNRLDWKKEGLNTRFRVYRYC